MVTVDGDDKLKIITLLHSDGFKSQIDLLVNVQGHFILKVGEFFINFLDVGMEFGIGLNVLFLMVNFHQFSDHRPSGILQDEFALFILFGIVFSFEDLKKGKVLEVGAALNHDCVVH